jgi:hypothetical protein
MLFPHLSRVQVERVQLRGAVVRVEEHTDTAPRPVRSRYARWLGIGT